MTVEELPANMGSLYSVLMWGGSGNGIAKKTTNNADRTAFSGTEFGGNTITFGGGGKAIKWATPSLSGYVWRRVS